MPKLQPLKVLLLEDNPGDVLLLRTALEADQLSIFELTVVDTLAAGLHQIQQAAFDIVLVDLGLPDSTGLQTFERIHKTTLTLPVVVFSGNEDEQQAIDAVRAGAQDYLVKSLSGFEMAARTIRYAIERNNLHGNLRESEQRFSTLFRSNPVPVGITRQSDYRIVDVNDAWTNLTGYTRDEAIGHTSTELGLVKPEILQQVREILRDQEEINQYEVPLCRRSGQERLILLSSEPIQLGSETYILNNLLDITERKQAEDALKESEEQFSKLFFTNPVSQSILSRATGQIMEVNDACCRLYEYSHEELIGIAPEKLDLWVNSADQLDALEELQRTGHLLPREVTVRPKSGEIRTILFSVEQIVWKGEPCLITSSVDITEHKKAEKQVTQMKRLYATLSQVNQTIVRVKDHADLYQSICDVSTKFGEFALAWIGILNTETGDINPVAANGLDLAQWPFPQVNINEGDLKNGLAATAMRTSRVVTSDDIAVDERTAQSRLPLNQYDYHSIAIVPFQLRGTTIGILCLVSSEKELFKVQDEILLLQEMGGDISFALDTMETEAERKQAEEKNQSQLEQIKGLRTIDQAISSSLDIETTLNVVLQQVLKLLKVDAVSILLFNDAQQKLEYATSKGFRSASVSQSQIRIGEGLAGHAGLSREILHIPDLVQIGDKFLRAEMLKDDQFVEYFGVPLVVKDSLKGVLEIFNRTPLNPDAEWLNFLEVLGGQTAIAIDNAQLFEELQHSNAELEQRVKMRTTDLLLVNAELEHANRTKDEFLANMSHELRTPLTGIIGLTESLLLSTYGQPNEKQSKALKNIEASGRHLLELINDILDLSKIEAGKFDVYPEMIDIAETCRASLVFVKEQANKKSILLEYQEAKGVKSVFADPRRLKQILVNLLSNAVKFTPEKGKVTLAVSTDPEKGQIHFSVTDTGIGIAKEDLDRLFTPFTQVDSRLNRQYEGTGLGLVLVLRLAEMHGGNVEVETEPGKGSRFTVSLPWQLQVSTPIETKQSYIDLTAESVANTHGVLLLVEDNASNVETIGDYLQFKGYTLVIASNGVEALVKAEESNPNLILMDIQMPVMDGLEATRRLRADSRFTSTPIIALTALAMTGDRERCMEAGATDYLSKPVSLKELTELINKLLQP